MKKTIAVWMLLAPAICLAQPPSECKPSSLNVPGAPYPCVFPDRRAMFRLSAPDAQRWLSWRRALADFAPRLFQ